MESQDQEKLMGDAVPPMSPEDYRLLMGTDAEKEEYKSKYKIMTGE